MARENGDVWENKTIIAEHAARLAKLTNANIKERDELCHGCSLKMAALIESRG